MCVCGVDALGIVAVVPLNSVLDGSFGTDPPLSYYDHFHCCFRSFRLRFDVIAVPFIVSHNVHVARVCEYVFLRSISCETEASLIALGIRRCSGIGVPKKEDLRTNLLLLASSSHASVNARSAPPQRNDSSAQQDSARSNNNNQKKESTKHPHAVVFARGVVPGASIFFFFFVDSRGSGEAVRTHPRSPPLRLFVSLQIFLFSRPRQS